MPPNNDSGEGVNFPGIVNWMFMIPFAVSPPRSLCQPLNPITKFKADTQTPNLSEIRMKLESGTLSQFAENSTNDLNISLPGNINRQTIKITSSSLIQFIIAGVNKNAGTANLTLRLLNQKTNANGSMLGNAFKMNGSSEYFVGTLNRRDQIRTNATSTAALGASLATAPRDFLFFIPLPKDAVGIGSTWTAISSLGIKGNGIVKSILKANGQSYWILDFKMTLPISVSAEQMASMVKKVGTASTPMKMSLKGTYTVNCEEWVNQNTGAIKSLHYTADLSSKLNFISYGMSATESGMCHGILVNLNPNA